MPKDFPAVVSTSQLAELLAGGDDYIRTKDNVVMGLALKPSLNPEAPEIVIFGTGPNIFKRAGLLAKTSSPVPVYVKCAVKVWRYAGMYRSVGISQRATDIRRFGASRPPGSVGGILFLERCDTERNDVVAGGFANVKARKETEIAAVTYVQSWLTSKGYEVEDWQVKNLGYDLKAIKDKQTLLVEVKGTDFPVPRFFITRNEASCARNEKNWRLFVVTRARDEPRLHRYTHKEMLHNFQLDPLAWQCTIKVV